MATTSSTDGSDRLAPTTPFDDDRERDVEKDPATNRQDEKTERQPAESDPDVVDWDGPDDPANPQNWPSSRKWANIAVLAAINFFSPVGSSMFAPGVPQAQQEFHAEDQTLATFVVSVFLLGYVAGPLVLVPLSDIYGRVPVYHLGNTGFIIFTVACAVSSNFSMLIGFRFLAGMLGAAPMTIGAGTIADIIPPQQRGTAITIWSLPVVLGPVIGPVAGGFLTQAEGWRWLFWLIAIASGVVAIAGVIVFRETNASVILQRKVKRLRKVTGNPNLRSKLDSSLTPRDLLTRAIVRPTKLLFLSPICGLMCLYNAFIYAILYLFIATFTFVFEDDYHFSEGTVGLVYIGMGIGMTIGMVLYGMTSDRIRQHLINASSDGQAKPEYRLPPTIFASPFIPVGLFIYGWTAQYHVHWAVPLFGTLLTGFGFTTIMASVANYLIDCYTIYAASAMAASTVSRSIFAATFPLFALHMYNALDLGWGNSLLAFISLAMCPIPALFYIYGGRLRTNPRFQLRL